MRGAVAFLVAIPAGAGLLAVAAEFHQPVGNRQLAVVGIGGGAAPAGFSADVLENRKAQGFMTASSWVKMSFLTSIRSNTASTTTSQSLMSSRAATGRIRARRRSISSSARLPRLTEVA